MVVNRTRSTMSRIFRPANEPEQYDEFMQKELQSPESQGAENDDDADADFLPVLHVVNRLDPLLDRPRSGSFFFFFARCASSSFRRRFLPLPD